MILPVRQTFRLALPALIAVALCAAAWAGVPETTTQAAEPEIRLIGVLELPDGPRALVAIDGVENEALVGEGDLVAGFTIRHIGGDWMELAQGDQAQRVTVGGREWIQPDLTVKTYARAYSGPNDYHLAETAPTPEADTISARKHKVLVSQRPKFIRPVRGGWISSPFGKRLRPRNPRTGVRGSAIHKGTDIAAPYRSRINAAADGVVVASDYAWHREGRVEIKHSGGYSTVYLHLRSRSVKKGDRVKAGQKIGEEGGYRGISTGAHLHFEIRKNGVPLDPALYISSLKSRR